MDVRGTRYTEFQSTLPMQGVTASGNTKAMSEIVSIHTPYAGSDVETAGGTDSFFGFNPHSLCRE